MDKSGPGSFQPHSGSSIGWIQNIGWPSAGSGRIHNVYPGAVWNSDSAVAAGNRSDIKNTVTADPAAVLFAGEYRVLFLRGSPVTYLVDIEAFHGPLDLLLFLIEKNELDIYAIPIAFITDQYLQYLQATGEFDLDNMGEFLIMATYLLNLKSRLLLPRTSSNDPEDLAEDAVDPREELVQKLLDYRRYKEAGQQLQERELGLAERIFYREIVHEPHRDEELIVDLTALVRAYRAVMRRLPIPEPEAIIPEGDVNVSDKMNEIMELLAEHKGKTTFTHLFANVSHRREGVALFLALLELIRLQKVKARQNNRWEDIQLEMW